MAAGDEAWIYQYKFEKKYPWSEVFVTGAKSNVTCATAPRNMES